MMGATLPQRFDQQCDRQRCRRESEEVPAGGADEHADAGRESREHGYAGGTEKQVHAHCRECRQRTQQQSREQDREDLKGDWHRADRDGHLRGCRDDRCEQRDGRDVSDAEESVSGCEGRA